MAKRHRVIVVCFTGASGITHYSISLARKLARHFRVTLVVGMDYQEQGYPPPTGFELVPFFNRSRWYPLDLIRLIWMLVRERPQTVLFQSLLKSAGAEALAVRLIGFCGIQTAMTIHDVLPHYPYPWSRWSHFQLYRAFDKLIVHSHLCLDEVRTMGVTRQILVVPHGLYDLFITRPPQRDEARRRLTAFALDDFVLLFFGKIDSRKGVGRFLALWKELSGKERYRFVIAGRAGIRKGETGLLQAMQEARVSDDCIVHDHDIPFLAVQDYFALSDAVVLPYQEGTTSGVLKLALAFGKPVIATNVGDLAEALCEDIGLLLPVRCSAKDLATAVREIRRNYERYQAECVAASERYSWDRIGVEYARFLLGTFPKQTVLQGGI